MGEKFRIGIGSVFNSRKEDNITSKFVGNWEFEEKETNRNTVKGWNIEWWSINNFTSFFINDWYC